MSNKVSLYKLIILFLESTRGLSDAKRSVDQAPCPSTGSTGKPQISTPLLKTYFSSMYSSICMIQSVISTEPFFCQFQNGRYCRKLRTYNKSGKNMEVTWSTFNLSPSSQYVFLFMPTNAYFLLKQTTAKCREVLRMRLYDFQQCVDGLYIMRLRCLSMINICLLQYIFRSRSCFFLILNIIAKYIGVHTGQACLRGPYVLAAHNSLLGARLQQQLSITVWGIAIRVEAETTRQFD